MQLTADTCSGHSADLSTAFGLLVQWPEDPQEKLLVFRLESDSCCSRAEAVQDLAKLMADAHFSTDPVSLHLTFSLSLPLSLIFSVTLFLLIFLFAGTVHCWLLWRQPALSQQISQLHHNTQSSPVRISHLPSLHTLSLSFSLCVPLCLSCSGVRKKVKRAFSSRSRKSLASPRCIYIYNICICWS